MDINISLKNESKEDLLKSLSIIQKEIEKMEDEETVFICNAGHFIIVGIDGHTVFVPTSIKRKDDKKMTDLDKLEEKRTKINLTIEAAYLNNDHGVIEKFVKALVKELKTDFDVDEIDLKVTL